MAKKLGDKSVRINNQLIRDAFDKLNIFEFQLAKRAGVSAGIFNVIMNGEHSTHRENIVRRICHALHLSYEDVIYQEPVSFISKLAPKVQFPLAPAEEAPLTFAQYNEIVAPKKVNIDAREQEYSKSTQDAISKTTQPTLGTTTNDIKKLVQNFNLLSDDDRIMVLHLMSSLANKTSIVNRMKEKINCLFEEGVL